MPTPNRPASISPEAKAAQVELSRALEGLAACMQDTDALLKAVTSFSALVERLAKGVPGNDPIAPLLNRLAPLAAQLSREQDPDTFVRLFGHVMELVNQIAQCR
jgi:hypothetical protein